MYVWSGLKIKGYNSIMTITVVLFLGSRRIEELSQSLATQDKLVEQLSQEKHQLLRLLEEPASMEVQVRLVLCFLKHLFLAFMSPAFFVCLFNI